MAERNFSWHSGRREFTSAEDLVLWLGTRYDGLDEIIGREEWMELTLLVALVVRQIQPRVSIDGQQSELPPEAIDFLVGVYAEFMEMMQARVVTESRELIAKRRLFISHRQIDAALAERMACIAQEHQFAYWLDVHDPFLHTLTGRGVRLAPQVIAVLTAAIIEIALINCSHVIALISPQARGSMWIPYELGRAKKSGSVWSLEASSWVARGVGPIPEYLHLAPIHRCEAEIRGWLGGAMVRMPCSNQTPCHSLDKFQGIQSANAGK